MLGGLVTNSIWCTILIARNGSAGQWVGGGAGGRAAPLARNFLLCAIGGTLGISSSSSTPWARAKWGAYAFSIWTLHMASIILFSTLWGFAPQGVVGRNRSKTRSLCGGESDFWSAPLRSMAMGSSLAVS